MKVWLITGSSRGLGRAIAEAVLANGDRLLATARKIEPLNELIERFGDRIAPFPLDVADAEAAGKAVTMAVSQFGRLDVLVNNAGYGTLSPIEDTSIEELQAQIATNLLGTIYTTRAAIPIMREQGAGHIIQFSSVGGRTGAMGRAAYSAAKWGVEGFSEVLAKEVGPLGIKVTIMEPGGFRTDFAAPSTIQTRVRPEYDSTVGAAARFQTEYNGKQPGDPRRAAEVVLKVVGMKEPPLRLLLGTDALKIAEQADLARIESGRRWRELSSSTDLSGPR